MSLMFWRALKPADSYCSYIIYWDSGCCYYATPTSTSSLISSSYLSHSSSSSSSFAYGDLLVSMTSVFFGVFDSLSSWWSDTFSSSLDTSPFLSIVIAAESFASSFSYSWWCLIDDVFCCTSLCSVEISSSGTSSCFTSSTSSVCYF